jgi:two-component system sensor kinase
LAVAAGALFLIDLFSPLGFAIGHFYIPLVAAAAVLSSPMAAGLFTLICLVLMGVEVFSSVDPISMEIRDLAMINRGLAMLMTATIAVVIIPVRRIRAALSAGRERYEEELEERARRRTLQLEAVNKELEAFTYSVSHDLRAPLRGMSGFARILEEDYGDKLDDDGRRYLEIIKSNAAQMGQLIDDLLALSRLGRQPLRAASISLEQIAAEAFRRVTADEPPRTIEFTVEPLPNCRGDANLMQQVFVNLLSNAVKFTRHRSPARIEVGGTEKAGERTYFVRDNGAGFDMRYVGKLFGVFQRLHGPEEFAGTGVGLAIVKRIIERHGGRIWAEGEPGKGATFWFTLGDEQTHVG